jgi:hypothetical protein
MPNKSPMVIMKKKAIQEYLKCCFQLHSTPGLNPWAKKVPIRIERKGKTGRMYVASFVLERLKKRNGTIAAKRRKRVSRDRPLRYCLM